MLFSAVSSPWFAPFIIVVVFLLNAAYLAATAVILAVVDDRIANNGTDYHAYLYALQSYIDVLEQTNNTQTIPDPYLNATVVEYTRFNSTYLIFAYIGFSFVSSVCIWRYLTNLLIDLEIPFYLTMFYLFNTLKYGVFAFLLAASSQISDPKLLMFMIASTMACTGYIMYRNNTMANTKDEKVMNQTALAERQFWLFGISLFLFVALGITVLSYAASQPEPAYTCDVTISVISLIIFLAMLFFEAKRWPKVSKEAMKRYLKDLEEAASGDNAIETSALVQQRWEKSKTFFQPEQILMIVGCLDSLYTIVSISYAAATADGACGLTI